MDGARDAADTLTQVAVFAAETPSDAIPDVVLERTALILADSIGAIVGGAAEPDVAALIARQRAGGDALVIGTSERRAPGTAALLNGTAGTTLEMDEGNQFCKGHPGMHTIPAALAVAGEVSGRDLLAAIAIGYDVGARVGVATALRPSMHPHGTWGAICAATVVARLAGADAATMRQAISLSASLGLTTSRRTMLEGGTVRNVFAGVSGQMGVLAGDLVASGFTGDLDGVAQVFGHVASDSFDSEAFAADLGRRWEVARNYFKMHSCCRYNHATLDVLMRLIADHGITAADVENVEVETYSLAVELDDPAPINVLAAKFSVPFAVATTLVNGATDVSSFTMPNVENAAIRALAARVSVREDPAMTAQLPDKRPARVKIHLRDGRSLSATTETNRGDWADPFPQAEVRAKYLSLATRLWPQAAAEGVWDQVMELAAAPSCAPLMGAMASAAR